MTKLAQSALPAAVVLALLAVPSPATAQEQAQEAEAQEQCNVEIVPQEIEAGKAAVQVTATFSSDIGLVRELSAPEDSGIALASAEDLAMVQMARAEIAEGEEAEQPQPIAMVGGTNEATIWLSTQEAEPGTYRFTLKGATGDCAAEVIVTEAGESN